MIKNYLSSLRNFFNGQGVISTVYNVLFCRINKCNTYLHVYNTPRLLLVLKRLKVNPNRVFKDGSFLFKRVHEI